MKYWHKDHIGVYENFVPKSYCDEVIDLFNTKTSQEENVIYRDTLTVHKDDIATSGVGHPLAEKFYQNMVPILDLYGKKYGMVKEMLHYGDCPPLFCDFKIQKTKPTEGYHIWHAENSGGKSIKRFLVWTLYLNDVSEGGETEFLNQSLRVPPTTGTVCVFPAYFTHLHRGNPPLSNTKYIATGWITQDLNHYLNHQSNEFKNAEEFIKDGDWNEYPIQPLLEKYYNE